MRTYRTCCVALSPAAERGPTAEKLCRYCAEILCFCPFHTLRRQILCREFALTLIFFQGGLSQPVGAFQVGHPPSSREEEIL